MAVVAAKQQVAPSEEKVGIEGIVERSQAARDTANRSEEHTSELQSH